MLQKGTLTVWGLLFTAVGTVATIPEKSEVLVAGSGQGPQGS